MGWLDYPPGPIGWLGAAADGMSGGGDGEVTGDDVRNNDALECSFACGACDAPISASDSSCSACGEVIEWDKEPIWEC